MWAMIVKEFRQLRRDRRTLAMMIVMPILLLVVLGYAASFDVSSISVAVSGPQAAAVARTLPQPFRIVSSEPGNSPSWAQAQLRDGRAEMAVVTDAGRPVILIDGSQLFAARAALAGLARLGQAGAPSGVAAGPRTSGAAGAAGTAAGARLTAAGPGLPAPKVSILYNPKLTTSDIMIPGLAGVVLVFIGTIITSLGVVRAVGIAIFGVSFRGSAAVFALGALLFLFVTLGIGVLISSISQNQGQAIQLAVMTLLPQALLSGLIFPLSSIAA